MEPLFCTFTDTGQNPEVHMKGSDQDLEVLMKEGSPEAEGESHIHDQGPGHMTEGGHDQKAAPLHTHQPVTSPLPEVDQRVQREIEISSFFFFFK